MISGSAIVCTPYAIDVMHRLTPGIAHAQTIQRPTRGAPSRRIAEHRTRVAGKMLQTCPLRRKRWLFILYSVTTGATWRSALWAVPIAYQATTTSSARVGVLPLEVS